MTRTDIHRPSVIQPADYSFVGFEYLGQYDPDATLFYRQMIREHMARTGGTYSQHAHGGSCHICGAHAVYTALFHHLPTNTYIRTGLECCDKLDGSVDGTEFRKHVHAALEAQAGKRKAKALLEEAGHGAAWDVFMGTTGGDKYEEATIADMVSKLVRYGSISDKAMNYIGVLLDKIAKRDVIAAERAAERAAAAPVPTGRMVIRGKVLTVKSHHGAFGMVTRMLVKTEAGWTCYGTVPAALGEVSRGMMVEFTGTLEPSKYDPKFGFFSRPAKASVLTLADGTVNS